VDVSSEGLVLWTGLTPGVSTTCEIDEDDTKGPNVVGLGVVANQTLKQAALAFR
jgi:hypothetical protein